MGSKKDKMTRWKNLPDSLTDRIVKPEVKNDGVTDGLFDGVNDGVKPAKPAKYHNKKCQYDGKNFDSIKEKDCYISLQMRKMAGEIAEVECQPKFLYLVTYSSKSNSFDKTYKYIADFRVTYPDGMVEIWDVKGYRTKEYRQKKKIIEKLYGIEIIEK